ncbi:hypothetical protein [Reyranella sp.]|jgi:hypothetical protein|uniref:hypothetical protein n=1 Tax=Reyranella sp. TaxID=1929291 RepID=UPI002F954F1E
MARYDHIHDDNVVPLFEDILARRQRRAVGRFGSLRATLRRAWDVAFCWRKAI